MTKDKERDDALIAEIAEVFPPDTVDVQSRYVIVHQLRASADIQDAQTKRETGWADTSDRACLMRKAADALDALLAKLQPAPKPDRAEVLSDELLRSPKYKPGYLGIIRRHFAASRAEWEAERECPSCHGLNLSCPDGCGRDRLTGELNGTRLEARAQGLVEALERIAEYGNLASRGVAAQALETWRRT